MSNEQRLEQLHQLISELETEMWYNIHADSPHRAVKSKESVDHLKDEVNQLINENLPV